MTGQRDNASGQTEERIREIEVHGMAASGWKDLIRHLEGKPLQRGQAIKAKCYDCMGYYADGRGDCFILSCPLHGFMSYKGRTGVKQAVGNPF